MVRVSVIGTVHNDLGRADASSLLDILGQLQPQVVFLEQPAVGFEEFCRSPRRGLESLAVCHYRQAHTVTLVPVDLLAPPLALHPRFNAMFEAIEDHSPQYVHLMRVQDHYTATVGFAFLNSPDGASLSSSIEAAELSAVQAIGNDDLLGLYHLWRDTRCRREAGMMNTVEAYCRENTFERGTFLVGAAHIQSLHVRSQTQLAAGPPDVLWLFPGLSDRG